MNVRGLFNLAFAVYMAYVFGLSPATIVGCAVCMGGFMVWALYTQQNMILYVPKAMPPYFTPKTNPEGLRSPSERSMLFEDENLRTRDGETLHCWMIKQSGAAARQAPTFLVFHANAGNMGMRLPQLELMYKKLECNIFIISYRGYGESTGTPTEQGIAIDAETAMEHLLARTDIDRSLIFLHGTSLGGAVAVSILSNPKYGFKLCGVVLENTFAGISEMADQLFPFIRPIKHLILKIFWPSRERLERCCPVPILFLSGRQDEIVPCGQMDQLFAAAKIGAAKAISASEFELPAGAAQFPQPTHQMVQIPDGSHNDTWLKGALVYFPALQAFMVEQMRTRGPLIRSLRSAASE